jgi:hypothetical protein
VPREALQILLLEVCLSQGVLFWGLSWLTTFQWVPREADVVTVNPKGERSIVWLAEWLLTLGAQDGDPRFFHRGHTAMCNH